MFYNGNVKIEPGAVVCRVAPSFVRFGTFQLPVSRGGMQVGCILGFPPLLSFSLSVSLPLSFVLLCVLAAVV
jgi:hypothetical protein